ncbi:Ephrin type-A receptor 4a (Fragment) [Geodia barretti]
MCTWQLTMSDKERNTHHGQGYTVGVGVGVTAIIIALALLALGAFIYIKKKRKVLVQPPVVANPTVHLSNYEVEGTGKDSQQQRSGNKAKSHEYQSLTPPTYCNMVSSTAAPLAMLTVGGEGHYETSWDALETVVDYYVPTTIQRRNYELEEDGSCPYIVAVEEELFVEQETFWSPGFTLASIYNQLSNHKFREINKQHIEIGGSLGSGEFGVVSKGRWMAVVRGPVEVAMKTLRPAANEDTQVKFLQEAAVIGQFKHPNIVKLHGVVTVEEPMMIVMEFMANGDLKNYLISLITDPDPPEQDQLSQLCLTFCRQIASGMSYLADKAFVHRDLAARNILVSKDKVCKVADFGMSRALNYSDYYVSHGGMIPVKWTAPEAIHYKKYTTASDVWSFGCVMYEIWSVGHKPFEGFTNAEAMEMVTRGYRLQPPPGCPRRIYSMMISCWHPERLDRPSFPSVCQTLAEEANSLLKWREEDSLCHPHASLLGAPLETGASLYPDLQNVYQGRQ